jgi:hypothetical protein
MTTKKIQSLSSLSPLAHLIVITPTSQFQTYFLPNFNIPKFFNLYSIFNKPNGGLDVFKMKK